MMEAVLEITMLKTWLKEISEETKAEIKLLECIPDKDLGGRLLFEIETRSENVDDILDKINTFQQICKVEMSPYKKGGYLGSIVTDNCITCQALTGSNCFLTYAAALSNGKIEWHLIVGEEKSLSKLVEFLEMKGCAVELKSKTYLNKKNLLTSKQEKIIKIAFEKGYYDYPKGITLRGLSNILKISSSTLNEILRRGEKKIIRDYYSKK